MRKKFWILKVPVLLIFTINAFGSLQTINPACPPILINQNNVIGILSVAIDPQVTHTRILFRDGENISQQELNLLREDAEDLRVKIGALMSKTRTRPLRFSRTLTREGICMIWALEDSLED